MTLIKADLDNVEDYILITYCKMIKEKEKDSITKEDAVKRIIRSFGDEFLKKMQQTIVRELV